MLGNETRGRRGAGSFYSGLYLLLSGFRRLLGFRLLGAVGGYIEFHRFSKELIFQTKQKQVSWGGSGEVLYLILVDMVFFDDDTKDSKGIFAIFMLDNTLQL